METIIGTYKQFIILERESLNELKTKANEYLQLSDADVSNYHKAMAILECIDWIKENNIYNSGNLKVHK